MDLENIRCTLVWLHFLGLSFHFGNFADRGRYECLVCPFSIFFDSIITKLVELNFTKCVDKMNLNKDKVIHFLKKNNWTKLDMGHGWFTNKYSEHCIGKQTNNDLEYSKGVKIQ